MSNHLQWERRDKGGATKGLEATIKVRAGAKLATLKDIIAKLSGYDPQETSFRRSGHVSTPPQNTEFNSVFKSKCL